MIDEVAKHVLASHPHAGKVGVLATTGTVRAGLYQDWLGRIGVEVITPSADEQDRAVMAGIRAVKAGARPPAPAPCSRTWRRASWTAGPSCWSPAAPRCHWGSARVPAPRP